MKCWFCDKEVDEQEVYTTPQGYHFHHECFVEACHMYGGAIPYDDDDEK